MNKKIMLFFSTEKIIFIISIVIVALFSNNLLKDAYTSRINTARALVEQNTFAIENVEGEKTVDQIFYNGHIYSSKPPLPAVTYAGIYYILHKTTNLEFNAIFGRIIILFSSNLCFALLLVFFYKSLEYFKIEKIYKIILTFSLGFSTLLFPYSTSLFNHTPAALFVFLSFYYLLKTVNPSFTKTMADKEEKNIPKLYALSGLFLSLAIVTETVQASIIFLAFFLFIILDKKYRKNIFWFLLGALPIGLLYIVYNLNTTGSILPPYFYSKRLYQFPGSYWANPKMADAFTHNKFLYFFNIMFGIQGIFLYTPVLIFGFWGIIKAIKNKTSVWQKPTWLILLTSAFIILFLTFTTNNYGGASYGFRWFIIMYPCVLFFTPLIFENNKNNKIIGWFLFTCLVSLIISFLGLPRGWFIYIREINGVNSYFPLLDTLNAYLMDIKAQL